MDKTWNPYSSHMTENPYEKFSKPPFVPRFVYDGYGRRSPFQSCLAWNDLYDEDNAENQ